MAQKQRIHEFASGGQLFGRAWKLARLPEKKLLAAGLRRNQKKTARESEDADFRDMMNRITSRRLRMADVAYGSEGHEECALAFAANRDPGWKWCWRIVLRLF